jgi:hypothetical protein
MDLRFFFSCLSSLKLWVRVPLMARCTRYNIMWSSFATTCERSVVFSRFTNKTDRHDINEILLKVTLNTITPNPKFEQPLEDVLRKIVLYEYIKSWLTIGTDYCRYSFSPLVYLCIKQDQRTNDISSRYISYWPPSLTL